MTRLLYCLAAALIVFGTMLVSVPAGLIVAGVLLAMLTTLLVLDVGGR